MKLHSVVKRAGDGAVRAVVIDGTNRRRTIEARWYTKSGDVVPANWPEIVARECEYQRNREDGPIKNVEDIPGVV
jgi:hypothetical protein